jgi:hypothetical protein
MGDLKYLQLWNNNRPKGIFAHSSANNIARYMRNNTLWEAHIFTTIGEHSINFINSGEIEYLIVAGGGGGGGGVGGGGGGGGILTGYANFENGQYEIFVGNGGAVNSNGQNSILHNLTAIGGGGGGHGPQAGGSGGSGGGGGWSVSGGFGTSDQGNNGGNGRTGSGSQGSGDAYSSGGGGGADSVGQNASQSKSGNGGNGISSHITGTLSYYGGGGGGGADDFRVISGNGTGGIGGGGNGNSNGLTYESSVPANGYAGTPNTGGGGGGGNNAGSGSTGGSGIVVIRYKLNQLMLFPKNGLLSHWSLDRNTNDSINNYNGSWAGTSIYENGIKNYAAKFDTNGDIRIPINSNNFENSLTVSCWVKVISQSGNFQMITTRSSGGSDSTHFELRLFLLDFTGYQAVFSHSNGYNSINHLTDSWEGEWDNLILVLDSGSKASFYVNGQLSGELNIGSVSPSVTNAVVNIGARNSGELRLNNAMVDEVYLWNRALSQKEVLQVYNYDK